MYYIFFFIQSYSFRKTQIGSPNLVSFHLCLSWTRVLLLICIVWPPWAPRTETALSAVEEQHLLMATQRTPAIQRGWGSPKGSFWSLQPHWSITHWEMPNYKQKRRTSVLFLFVVKHLQPKISTTLYKHKGAQQEDKTFFFLQNILQTNKQTNMQTDKQTNMHTHNITHYNILQ